MSNKILFWTDTKYQELSNFTAVTLEINGRKYDSVEHYYQSQKSTDEVEQEKIRNASTAYKSKKYGQKVKFLRSDWDSYKLIAMEVALREKFKHPYFKELLKSTQGFDIVENSPYDSFWGTGDEAGESNGFNHLGRLLMKIRDEINN